MRRLTSVLSHALPTVAALGLFIASPVAAQTTPEPTRVTPPRVTEPMRPGLVIPGEDPRPGQTPGAQQGGATTPPAAAPRPETPRAPSIMSQNNLPMAAATNIRLDLAITDTFTGSPVKKTVSLLILNGNSGMIRTRGSDGWSVLNVDAVAQAYQNGQVSLRMTFEYAPSSSKEASVNNRPPSLNESITVVLQDGKPMMVSQSADPATDRKVTAELTATILK